MTAWIGLRSCRPPLLRTLLSWGLIYWDIDLDSLPHRDFLMTVMRKQGWPTSSRLRPRLHKIPQDTSKMQRTCQDLTTVGYEIPKDSFVGIGRYLEVLWCFLASVWFPLTKLNH